MDTNSLDFNTLTLLVAIVGSNLTIVTLMFRQSNRHDQNIKALATTVAGLGTKVDTLGNKVTALEGRVDSLDNNVTALGTSVTALEVKVGALDTKLTDLVGKTEVMGRDVSDSRERLARVEGHLLAPGGFTLRDASQRDADEPPRDSPSSGHQEAG